MKVQVWGVLRGYCSLVPQSNPLYSCWLLCQMSQADWQKKLATTNVLFVQPLLPLCRGANLKWSCEGRCRTGPNQTAVELSETKEVQFDSKCSQGKVPTVWQTGESPLKYGWNLHLGLGFTIQQLWPTKCIWLKRETERGKWLLVDGIFSDISWETNRYRK